MNDVKIRDSDSNDSDIFVVNHIKPVVINSSKLIQSTLQNSCLIKAEVNCLNDQKNEKSSEKGQKRKGSNDSNEKKLKKIKRTAVFREKKPKKKLSKNTSPVKNKNDFQSTSSDKEIVFEKVKMKTVKSKQRCIQSYFVKKEMNDNFKELKNGNIKLEKQLKISNVLNDPDDLKIKNDALSIEKNLKTNDVTESIVMKEEVKNPLIIIDDTEDIYLEEESKIEMFSEASDLNDIQGDKNLKTTPDIAVKDDLNLEEFFSVDGFENDFFDNTNTNPEKGKNTDNSELLCFLLKNIIRDEIKKQTDLENQSLKNGRVFEKLILESECKILDRFFNLNENACKVFVRMLGRKKSWHRMCTINYPGIGDNLKDQFEILHEQGFIDINIENEDLKTQLDLLNKPEILELCKKFNVSLKSNSNSFKKDELINYLINDNKKQKSIFDIFKGRSLTTRLDVLKSKIKTILGSCVRLNDNVLQVFKKIILLFSFAHYHDEEEKRFSNELNMCLQVHKNFIKYPKYNTCPTVVFETLEDFEEYKNSLLLQDSFEVAINNKNHDAFVAAFHKSKVAFKKLLKNNEYQKRFLNLKSYLRKFSAGTVYAKILTRYCTTFKKQAASKEIADIAQFLLDQDLFLTSKKGEWYEILSKAFENQKQNTAAAETIIKSLKDSHINDVQKLTLQLRGQSILKKKSFGLSDVDLRNVLENLCTSSVQEPLSIEIKGKALGGNESGFKSVYVQEFENGKIYTTVEETAIAYYKSKGFTKGYHSEGFIIQSIYFLLFFDIIYGPSPEGVFQSPYQKAPLDFNSSYFFQNRKEEIELLMKDMLRWDEREIEAKIRDSYCRNFNSTCVISWDEKFTPEIFCEIIKCITMPILVSIFDRLVKNFRVYRSGFPDLTLWNPDTNECKFVEVKSPNDKLSPAQRIWLNYLRNIGLDCEVCNVKNDSSMF